jgi:hypothetical protein
MVRSQALAIARAPAFSGGIAASRGQVRAAAEAEPGFAARAWKKAAKYVAATVVGQLVCWMTL